MEGIIPVEIPHMFRIKQKFDGPELADIENTARNNIRNLGLQKKVKPGQSIAVAVGSRGIAHIARIVKVVISECKSIGLEPFIVPAMGSHGGATAEGQKQILEHYGISESTMGCPVKSSMEVVRIGETKWTPVFCDRNAWEADHIALVARVKAHTDFEGEIESGLFKMMSIGLGKRAGAEHYHRAGHHYSYAEVFPGVGVRFLEISKVLFGVAVVENGYDEIAKIEAILPKDFYETEKVLLGQAKAWMGRLPFEYLDLLIVDEIGKNISGAGMDPNVIGRAVVQKHPDKPRIRQIFARNLSKESGGNALGIGFADITTERLLKSINYTAMHINAITTGDLNAARLPMAMANDREAIQTALNLIGLTPPHESRIVRIKNTLNLSEMDVSEALQEEVKANDRLTRITKPAPMSFDMNGDLLP